MGCHAWQTGDSSGGSALARARRELEDQDAQWPPIQAGIFASAGRARELIDGFQAQMNQSGLG